MKLLRRIFHVIQALIFFLLAGYLWSWCNWPSILAVAVGLAGLPFVWWAVNEDVKKGR